MRSTSIDNVGKCAERTRPDKEWKGNRVRMAEEKKGAVYTGALFYFSVNLHIT